MTPGPSSNPSHLPTLRRAFGILFIAGIATRLLGVLREVLVAHYFGVSAGLDAVYLGLAIPLALTVGIGSGLIRAVVPVAAGLELEKLAGFVRAVCLRLTLLLTGIGLLLAITSPLWLKVLTIGDDGIPADLLKWSAILGCLAFVSVGAAGTMGGVANARGNHTSVSLSPLVYNLIVCLSIWVLHGRLGVLALPVGILVAELSQVLVHWPAVKQVLGGAVPRPAPGTMRHLGKVFWPAMGMGVLIGVNLTVDRVFASSLEDGSVAALAYAFKLVSLPAGLLGVALAVPLYTRLSHFKAHGNEEAFRQTLLLGLRLLVVSGFPIAAILFWTSRPLLGLLLERGAFDSQALELTATAFGGYAAGLSFIAASMLLTSASLTLARPHLVLWLMVGTSIVNFFLDWALVVRFGIFGLSITTSIVAFLVTILMIRIVAPTLVFARDLWVPMLRGFVLSLSIFLAGWLLMPMLEGIFESITLERLFIVMVILLVGVVIAGLSWPVYLAREWRELEILRGAVAGYVREKTVD